MTTLEFPTTTQESEEDSQLKAKRMTNEEWAHELLLNPTFQMTEAMAAGCTNIAQERIKASFQKAFWTSLEVDLRLSPPCYVRILRVLTEVRGGIAEMAGGGHALQVRELVDIELTSQRTKENIMEWTECMQ